MRLMKFLFVSILLIFMVLPVFSQDEVSQRFRALGDAMDNTISITNSRLASFDERVTDNSNVKTFSTFRVRYEDMLVALRDSEMRLDLFIRSNDNSSKIRDERDRYEGLIRDLEGMKSDYDSWLRSVQ